MGSQDRRSQLSLSQEGEKKGSYCSRDEDRGRFGREWLGSSEKLGNRRAARN